MPTFTDIRGVSVTAASKEAVSHLDEAIDDFTRYHGQPFAHADAALSADPNFALAKVFNAVLPLLVGQTGAKVEDIQRALKEVESPDVYDNLTAREQYHVRGLRLLADGKLLAASREWEACVIANPLDLLATRFASDCYFYTGSQQRLCDVSGRVLLYYTPSTPGYAALMAMRAYSLCEIGHYPEAEAAARLAMQLREDNAWAVHALCHIHEETNRIREGINLIQGTRHLWQEGSLAAVHTLWHWALYELDCDNAEESLAIYDNHVRKKKTDAVGELIDCTSLLWRYQILGIDVGDRWTELTEIWGARIDAHINGTHAWNDPFLVMTMCNAQSPKAECARRLIDHLRAMCGAHPNHPHWERVQAVSLPICDALLAYSQEEYQKALSLILPLRYNVKDIAGSNAQRDVFARWFIDTASRAQDHGLARAWIQERCARRPDDPATWRLLQQVIEAGHGKDKDTRTGVSSDVVTETTTSVAERVQACQDATKPVFILLLGPNGTGKTTQCELLARRFNMHAIHTADLVTLEAKKGDANAIKACEIMSKGVLIPDEDLIPFMRKHILNPDYLKQGFIIEGFPCTEVQAQAFLDMLAEVGVTLDAICVNMYTPELVVNRSKGRYRCSQCLFNYHVEYKQPKVEGVCDMCQGTEFSRRSEDDASIAHGRIKVFEGQTKPCLPLFDQDRIVYIDASQPLERVHQVLSNIVRHPPSRGQNLGWLYQ